jgi:bacterioferritin (cytochrome b1)
MIGAAAAPEGARRSPGVSNPIESFDGLPDRMAQLSAVEREIVVYSYYRDAELRGANLLFRLLRIVDEPESQVRLTEHLADEVRHAWLWTELIQSLGAHPVSILDGYQVRIGKRAGIPRTLVDLFALTVVVEQRALRRYTEHMRRPGTSARTLGVLAAVTQDEGWHVDWMRRKARELAGRDGDPEQAERAIERFREIDRAVMIELEAAERRLAEV